MKTNYSNLGESAQSAEGISASFARLETIEIVNHANYYHSNSIEKTSPARLGHIFKSLMFTLAIFVAGVGSLWGQNFATIGSGTATTTSTGSDPIYGYWNSFRYQVVYTAAELTAAGMTANAVISGLGFSISGDYAGGNLLGYEIKMAHTTATNCANHNTTALTQVKTAFNYNPTVTAAGAFDMITFSTNFTWNGASNILVDICSAGPNPYIGPYGQVRTTGGTTTNRSRSGQADAAGSQCGVATTTANSNKPQIRFAWGVSSACSGAPAAGTATITSATGCPSTNFTLNSSGVTSGTGISYQWQTSSTAGGTYTNVGAAGSSLTTSTATTAFYRLRTTCSNGGSTNETNVVSYTVAGGVCACAAYPANYASNTADEEITNVTVGSMNNSSNCATAATGAGSVLNRYGNYAGVVTGPTAQQSSSVNFSLTQTSCGGAYNNYFQIYVDWNQDGDWLDVGEQVYSQGASVTGNQTVTGSFPIPATATIGTTRMRVLNAELIAGTGNYAHTAYTYGETEDYCFTVTAPVPCSGTPAPGNTLTSSASVAPGSTVNLSLSTPPSGSGLTYAWQSGPSNSGPWTPLGTASTQTSPAITANTWYRCIVTCSGLSGTSTAVQVTVSACIPVGSISYYLTNVSTSGAQANFANPTGASAGGYGNYYATIGAQVPQGMSVTVTMNSIYSSDYFQLWIDWNNDLDFLDAGEAVYNSAAYVASGVVTINVGAAQPLGTYRMRVSNGYLGANTPCGPATYGEFEDYYIQVIAPPACMSPTALISSAITSTTATISWTAASPAPASGYQYYYSTVNTAPTPGTTPSGSTAAGITSANLTGLTANTTYYFWVRSNCGGSGTSAWAGASNFFTGYCIPTGTAGYYITNVTTTSGATNIANTSASNAGYGNFTAQSASNYIGTGTNFSVGHTATLGGAGVGVWIDWNNDLDFADVNEQIGLTTGWNYSPFTGTINIPVGTPVGNYRMRIVIDYGATSPISCPVGINGETEDYTFTVIALVPCAGTPSPGNTLTSSASVTSGSTVNLTLSTPPTGSGLTYQWQSGPSNTGPWTPLGTASTQTSPAITANTWYNCLVTCAGNTGTSAAVQVVLTACVPVTTYGCTDGDVIARVILNTLDNNSGTGCPSGVAGYSNYTSNPALTTTLLPSSTYNCTVYAGQYPEGYAAWIDYNDDLVFDNVTERIGYSSGQVAGSGIVGVLGSSAVFPITLACTPPAGNHILRVRAMYFTNGVDVTPCTGNSYGEVEDYMITISAAPACASPGLMSTITPAASSATLIWATNCSAATNYDFQYGPAGFALGTGTTLTNQAVTISAANASFNLTGLLGGTAYTVYYRANCGGVTSAWSIANNFTTPSIWTNAWVSMNTGAAVWCPGETRTVTVTVTNTGNMTWTNATPDINIGVKWNAEVDYFVRTDANGLAPGASQTYSLTMTAPLVLGANNLTFDIVKEGAFWFSSNGSGAGPGNVVYTSPTITISSPTVSAGAAMAAICQSSASAVLGGSFGGTATAAVWSGGAGTFANNTGSTPGTATYTANASETGAITLTLTTSGGPCGTIFATKTITVNPKPVIANITSSICSGNAFTFTPSTGGGSSSNDIVPANTTYTWSAPSVIGITGTAAGTSAPNISGTLTNTTNAPINVVYTVTPTALIGTCAGATFTVTITVNPTPAALLLTGSIVCFTTPTTITSSTSQSDINYQLYNSSGAVGSVLPGDGNGITWSAMAAGNGYYVIGTNTGTACASVASSTVNVVLNANTNTIQTNLGGVTLGAGDYLWNGSVSLLWENPANWFEFIGSNFAATANVPQDNDRVFILTNFTVGSTCINMDVLNPVSVSVNGAANGLAKDVYIGTGAYMTIAQDETLTVKGNWTNHGTFTANPGSSVVFEGSGAKEILGSTPTTFNNLTVNKTLGGSLTLQTPATVEGTLTMTEGEIVTRISVTPDVTNLLTVGTSASVPGSIAWVGTTNTWTGGTVLGPIKRWFASGINSTPESGIFPVGLPGKNRYAQVNHDAVTPLSVGGSITAEYKAGSCPDATNPLLPLYAGLPTDVNGQMIQNYENEGYWSIAPATGVDGGNLSTAQYSLKLRGNALSTVTLGAMGQLRMIKSSDPHTSWDNGGIGTNTGATGSESDFTITNTGMTGFSWFNIGSGQISWLPVELTNFAANCNEKSQVDIKWSTASEQNSEYFNIERSRDLIQWEFVSTINAAGNSNYNINYSTLDTDPFGGISYYRLVQVDNNGAEKIYGPISVSCSDSENSIIVFPNPTKGNFTVEISSTEIFTNAQLQITDLTGKVINQRSTNILEGKNQFTFEGLDLQLGTYIINLNSVNGKINPVRIVVD